MENVKKIKYLTKKICNEILAPLIPKKMQKGSRQSITALNRLQRAVSDLETPKDLFSGLLLNKGFVPDNVLFFRRTHTRAFSPVGVNNNYHHRFELVIVVQKGGAARIGNQSCFLEPGEAVLIFPNQFHHYMDVEKGDLEWLFITFELGDAALIEVLRDSPRKLSMQALGRVESIVRQFSASRLDEGDHALEISFILSLVLKEMLVLPEIETGRINIHSTDDSRDVLLEKINKMVRRNLHRSITIEEMAEEMECSVSHLRAVFRDKLGISLGRYIRDSRLSVAAQLLLSREYTVTEVAKQTGFESLVAFSRAFKNSYGTSPKAYSRIGDQ